MLLSAKTAVIFGAGGAVGGAVAKAFAREGARVCQAHPLHHGMWAGEAPLAFGPPEL
jgi:NAD(P)-dependent dehydrogenase (short-subunit alcohol dehydrogenase family)